MSSASASATKNQESTTVAGLDPNEVVFVHAGRAPEKQEEPTDLMSIATNLIDISSQLKLKQQKEASKLQSQAVGILRLLGLSEKEISVAVNGPAVFTSSFSSENTPKNTPKPRLQFALDPDQPENLCVAEIRHMSEDGVNSFWHCTYSSGFFKQEIRYFDLQSDWNQVAFSIPFGQYENQKIMPQGLSFHRRTDRDFTPQELRHEMSCSLETNAEARCVLFGYSVYFQQDGQEKEYTAQAAYDAMGDLARDAIDRLAPYRRCSGKAPDEDIIVLLCYMSRHPIYVVRDGGEGIGLEVTNYRAMVDQLVAKTKEERPYRFPTYDKYPWVDEKPFMVYQHKRDDATNPDGDKTAFALLTPVTDEPAMKIPLPFRSMNG